MDTTETYIKMCEQAKEIQSIAPDMGTVPPTNENVFIGMYGNWWACDWDWINSHAIYHWLPRQDQLQSMLETIRFDTSVHNLTLTYHFARFCGIDDQDAEGSSNIYLRKESMEVLWLAFVMRDLYKKVWNGSDWVNG